MSTEKVVIAAFYKFISIPKESLESIRERFVTFAEQSKLTGLLVMGTEGVNATVAGTEETIECLKDLLKELFPNQEITPKISFADSMPFPRFKVDIRPEIITTKDLSLSHEESAGTHLSPEEWHAMIENDPDVLIVDTRNDYETEIGVFEGAVDPKIKKFSEFQTWVEENNLPKDKKIMMYCTGGIRCEKAVPEVKRLGYNSVFQLEGGILKYLEKYPEGFFKGECFVFDHRVAVDGHLAPSKTYRLCPHCGNPAKERITCKECKQEAVVCHSCIGQSFRVACSKNCAHHIKRKEAKLPSTSDASV